MALGLLLVLGAAGLAAAESSPDEALARLRARVLDEAARVPNYTCVQTIDRQFFATTATRAPASCAGLGVERSRPGYRIFLYGSDRFRLDVGVGRTGEVYSWAGAERFEDRDLGDLIRGPSSTGAFATLLHMMFGVDAAEFSYRGRQTLDRRRLLAYSFRVPVSRSHYFLRGAPGSRRAVAYRGTILVDPETADLARLDIRIDDPPSESNLCEFSASLDYGRTQIGAAGFLLPKAARQRFVMPSRLETESTVAFSACREFKAESAVRYEDPAAAQPAGGNEPAVPEPLKIPAGLPVAVGLTAAIDSGAAAAGDAFAGSLMEPLEDQRGNTLAPRGTAVRGRVMRVERYANPASVQIGLTLEAIEIGGVALPFHAIPRDAGSKARTAPRELLPYAPENDFLVIQLPGDHRVLRPGNRTEWVTATP
jgi:hypothetical protein